MGLYNWTTTLSSTEKPMSTYVTIPICSIGLPRQKHKVVTASIDCVKGSHCIWPLCTWAYHTWKHFGKYLECDQPCNQNLIL